MYQLVGKLNRLKRVLKELNRSSFNEVVLSAEQAKEQLLDCQKKIQLDLMNTTLIGEEKELSKTYHRLQLANDVLLFCKGDFHSVMLILRGLKTFLKASGLTTNAEKSNIFSVNMNMQHLEGLCEITGYQKGKLPFRYLGVPITSRKISIVDFEILVDKLTVKVRGWGSRTLSYAGRVQLINSIKNEGGLGVTDCVSWNDAVIVKYVWNIAQKEDNLWVKWVNHLFIKEESWWDYEAPQDINWYWKKICHIRDKMAIGM
uniref:Uncharacterized protein n=1 Tax=Nicotiana tabacum TaxID=4097 RepID=A0A1S4CXN1_TOBAC|nr:PREDICTED: uncharacterized protein LOC107823607 [Nicotiana tabacum]